MEKITLILNDFLFNSGILGFYRILQRVNKLDLVEIKGNAITIQKKAIEDFTQDYFTAMLDTYESETRWKRLINQKEQLRKLNIEEKQDIEKLDKLLKDIKAAIESNSYKAGYEIAISKGILENPFEYLSKIQNTKETTEKIEWIFKILDYLEDNREIYCMKDIIYNKINVIWNNVYFLNRQSNKNDIKEEYQKSFVNPVLIYLEKQKKSDYTCIECGAEVSKSDTSTMSWLNDVGVDYKKKNSIYWNFKENSFICPICNLIYSCIPLGFNMLGSNGLFVNENSSIEMLVEQNNQIQIGIERNKEGFDNIYQKLFYNILNRLNQQTNQNYSKYEVNNIQVIKRDCTNKENPKYEFNLISKDKLFIFEKTQKQFENLLNKKIKINDRNISIYGEVLNNFLTNIKQYALLNQLLLKEINDNIHLEYIGDIIKIQVYCIGGEKVNELKDYVNEMKEAGEKLKKYFYANKENMNKLSTYRYRLGSALKINNIENFMEIFTRFYGGMGLGMPSTKAVTEMMANSESFRILGYAYVYGLGKLPDETQEVKQEIEGGLEDEE